MKQLNEQIKRIKEMYSFDEAGKQRGKSFTHKSTYNPGTHTCTNKDMSADVYKLRKMVMEYVYRAKKLVGGSFPRIIVKIVDITVEDLANADAPGKRRSSFLAFGGMGTNEIWVSEYALCEGFDVHELVFHEILHAAYGIEHNENSKLMGKYHNKNLSPELIDKLFISHVDKPNTNDWNLKYKGKL